MVDLGCHDHWRIAPLEREVVGNTLPGLAENPVGCIEVGKSVAENMTIEHIGSDLVAIGCIVAE